MPEPLRIETPIVDATGRPTLAFSRLWQTLFRRPVFRLGDAQGPPESGDLVVEATSDTSLTFRYRGSDGIVRSASLTLT